MGHPQPLDSYMLLIFFLSLKGRLQIRLGNEDQSEGAGIASQWVGDTEAGGKNGKKAALLPFVIYWLFFLYLCLNYLRKRTKPANKRYINSKTGKYISELEVQFCEDRLS